MEDISLHILDIAENSIRADAKTIEIIVTRDLSQDLFRVEVVDDGRGMDAETVAKVRDPFFSTKHKKTGLGIPLLSQAAELTGGAVTIESAPGEGTRVSATFGWGHLDRPPVGNMTETVLALLAGHPDRDYVYEERDGENSFRFDSRELRSDLDGIPLNDPAVLGAIRVLFEDNIRVKD